MCVHACVWCNHISSCCVIFLKKQLCTIHCEIWVKKSTKPVQILCTLARLRNSG